MLASSTLEKPSSAYPLAEQPDGVLARNALQGDELAFEVLVNRYSSRLFHFIYHLLGDYDRSCDILQQVMIQLHTSLPTLRQDGAFKSWLFQVAYHRAIDELRQKRLVHFSEIDPADEENEGTLNAMIDSKPLPEEQFEYDELQDQLQQAIQNLPERFQAIVSLRYAKQMTFREIGAELHMPEATAKTYFQRSKPLLRDALHAEHAYELLPQS